MAESPPVRYSNVLAELGSTIPVPVVVTTVKSTPSANSSSELYRFPLVRNRSTPSTCCGRLVDATEQGGQVQTRWL